MKKLKLELDALRVESFDAGRARAPRGTVRGHSGEFSCRACETIILVSCGGTCDSSAYEPGCGSSIAPE